MNKYITKKAPRQALFSINPQDILQCIDSERLKQDKESFFKIVSSCNSSEKKVINFLIKHHLKYELVTFGQEQIARSVGIRNRETVNRILKRLKSKSLVSYKSHQKQFTSNPYILSNLFFEYAQEFKSSFPALRAHIWKKISSDFSAKVTPYIEEVCNTLSNSMIIKGTLQATRHVVKNVKDFKNKFLRKQVSMETSPIKINNPLKRITEALSLNKWGQIRLLVYPERALAVVFEELKKKNYLRAPFFWLLAALDTYCLKNKLHVDWDLLPILKKKYDMPDKPVFFEVKKVVKSIAMQPQPDKIIVSPLVGLHKQAHPSWAMFIPDDLRLA